MNLHVFFVCYRNDLSAQDLKVFIISHDLWLLTGILQKFSILKYSKKCKECGNYWSHYSFREG